MRSLQGKFKDDSGIVIIFINSAGEDFYHHVRALEDIQLPSWAPLGTWAKQANDMCPNMPARGQPLSHRSDVPSPRHGHLLLQSTTSVCCNTSVWGMAGQPDPGPFSSPEPTAQVHQEQLTSGAHATVPGNLLFLLARADVS